MLSEVSEKFGVQCASIEDGRVWGDFFDYASASEFVTPMLLNRSSFDAVNAVLYKLQDLSSDILSSRSALNAVFDEDIYKLNGSKYHKVLTKRFEGTFSRLFNDEYKKLISDLRACKIDGKRLSYHEAVALTERLACYQQKSAEYMYGCHNRGIVRKNGFLYLDGDTKIRFRGPGDIVRDIKQISPEELAAGMLEILKQNVTAEKSGLYHTLAAQCGISRVGKTVNEMMESALRNLAGTVVVDGEQISLK